MKKVLTKTNRTDVMKVLKKAKKPYFSAVVSIVSSSQQLSALSAVVSMDELIRTTVGNRPSPTPMLAIKQTRASL